MSDEGAKGPAGVDRPGEDGTMPGCGSDGGCTGKGCSKVYKRGPGQWTYVFDAFEEGVRKTIGAGDHPIVSRMWCNLKHQLVKKLDLGYRTYGDDSFHLPPSHIINEIREEFLDVVGWGVIFWNCLDELQTKLENLEDIAGVDR